MPETSLLCATSLAWMLSSPSLTVRLRRVSALVIALFVVTGYLSAQAPGPLSPDRRKARRPARPAATTLTGETIMISGKLIEVYTTTLLVETPQGNSVRVLLSAGTRFVLEDRIITVETLRVGDGVTVHGVKQSPGKLKAIQVSVHLGSLTKSTTSAPTLIRSDTKSPQTRPGPPLADDDGGPPTLRRRKPGERRASTSSPDYPTTEPQRGETYPAESDPAESEPAESDSSGAEPSVVPDTASETAQGVPIETAPPIVLGLPEVDPVIARTREWVFSYSERLPNFICREVMTRMAKQGPHGWHTLDIVEADVVYEDQKESYRNIKINGKPAGTEMDQLEGSWSMGEFASTLLSVFSPASRTRFRFSRFSDVAGLPAKVYKFSISEPNSRWHVAAEGGTITPAYDGSVWIHEETAHVLRVETHAVDLPEDFDLDAIEMTVDYNRIRIAGGEYLLPVESENLGCWRGTGRCARNKIEFRNYRRFSAESSIVTTDSSIDYGDETEGETPKADENR